MILAEDGHGFRPRLRRASLLLFATCQPEKETDVEYNTHRCGCGGRQADQGQVGIWLNAHYIGHGQTDQKGLNHALNHNPDGLVVSVEVAYHAKQGGCKDGLRCEAFEVGVTVGDNGGIRCEDTGKGISLEPHQHKDGTAEHQTNDDTGIHGSFCPFLVSGSYVL